MVPKPNKRNKSRFKDDEDDFQQVSSKDIPASFNSDSNVKPPKHLIVSNTGMASEWKKWKQQWKWYYTASGLEGKSNTVQVASFMSSLGPDILDIYNSFEFSNVDDIELTCIINKFDEFFIGKSNEVFERYLFNKIVQEDYQPFDNFHTKLVNQAQQCNFELLKDSLIRDRIVVGVVDSQLREKLLSEDPLTLERCIKICRAHEQSKKQLSQMTHETDSKSVAVVKDEFSEAKDQNLEHLFECSRCGYRHIKGKCPAFLSDL